MADIFVAFPQHFAGFLRRVRSAGGLVFSVKMMPSGSVESMCSSVVFTREAEAAEITDAISELSYLALQDTKEYLNQRGT